MSTAELAQVLSALFTALAAFAALLAVRHSAQQAKIARSTLDLEIKPLLTDLPRGEHFRSVDWHNLDGSTTTRREDLAEIEVGLYPSGGESPRPVRVSSVPLRNVGRGTARISRALFRCESGEVRATASKSVVPSGEIVRVGFDVSEDDPDTIAGEGICMAYQDFDVVVEYSDSIGNQSESVTLHVVNGKNPRVTSQQRSSAETAV